MITQRKLKRAPSSYPPASSYPSASETTLAKCKPLKPFLVPKEDSVDESEQGPVSKYVIIERREAIPYRMITRDAYLASSQNEYVSEEEIKDAELYFDQHSVELNTFESEMFEQYREVCCAFNALCILKLAQRKPAVYDLMSKIYGVFEKYGIESGHRDEFVLRFVNNHLSDRPKHLRIGEGKFRGLFLYGHTLRFNLQSSESLRRARLEEGRRAIGEDQSEDFKMRVDKRVKLVNGELVSFEKEFKIVLNKLPAFDANAHNQNSRLTLE